MPKPDKKTSGKPGRLDKSAKKSSGLKPAEIILPPDEAVRQAERAAARVVRRLGERLADAGGEENLRDLTHEIRTPMSALLAYSDMLCKADTLKLSRSQVMDYAATIHEAVLRVLATTERSLEKHLTGGPFGFKPEPIDLYPFVTVMLKTFTGQAQRQKVEMAVDIQADFPKLNLDRVLLNSVLSSLVANSLRFTPGGGEVSFRARADEKNGALTLTVADTGALFPKDTVEAVERGEPPPPVEGEERGWRRSFGAMNERIQTLGGVLILANVGGKSAVARLRFPASAAVS